MHKHTYQRHNLWQKSIVTALYLEEHMALVAIQPGSCKHVLIVVIGTDLNVTRVLQTYQIFRMPYKR